MRNNKSFWKEDLKPGYYDEIITEGFKQKRGLQFNWHNGTYLNVLKLIQDTSSHLDYACGSGTFIGQYLEKKSIGVDIAPLQIDYAKQKYGQHKFLLIDDFNISNNEESFDTISVLGLLEFLTLKDSKLLLKQLSKLLSSEGKLILTTPNYSLFFRIFQKISVFFGINNYSSVIQSKYTKKKLEKLIQDTNLNIITIKKIINFGIFFSVINNKLGLKIERIIEIIFANFFGFILIVEVKN